jgi:hypothetical protein
MKSVGFAFLVPLTIVACGDTPRAPTRCEWPAESARPLDLTRAADRRHLRQDAQSAETVAIHYADAAPARREGPIQYAHAREACMASLFGVVARTHAVDLETVRAFSMHRNGWLDAIVLLSFAAVYGCAASALGGFVGRRFPGDEWPAAVVSMVVLSLAAAGLGLLCIDLWAIGAESIRLGTSHLSDRVERLWPRRHPVATFTTGVILFWLIGILRHRAKAPLRVSLGLSRRRR